MSDSKTTMETQAPSRSKRQTPSGVYAHLPKLALAGGVAFWATNFATSLVPIAAEYRAALSISYLPMVFVESLLGGLVIGCFVSYFLVRLFDRIPTETPILKAEILSVVALVIGIIVTGIGASRLEPNDALRYFLLGALLNVPRFLILGLVIGYLYTRLPVSTPDSRK
jgi:NhaP-type Na+/H+ or K+/H+ antiporter